MLSIACVHPKGEPDGTDTLYLCDGEISRCAEQLRNCPLRVEHDSEPVGKVIHAFKDSSDGRLHAVFETDPSTFGGAVAGALVRSGLTAEVSLGHECKIQHSADGSQRVVDKTPTELSIVQKGAREGTKIMGKTKKNTTKRYINIDAPKNTIPPPDMSATEAPQIPPADQSKANSDMMKQLLEQVKALTEAQTLSTKENESLKEANGKFAEQVEASEAAGKRKREGILDGSVKDYFATLMEKYQTELQPHEAQLQGMMDAMKSNAASEPMVAALACAAAAAKGSVTELEAQYQANKKMKLEIDELKKQYANQAAPLFSKKAERVETIEAQASAVVPKEPAAFSSIFGGAPRRTPGSLKGAGMRETNPAMWNDLVTNAPMGRGMPKIDAFMNMIKK